MSAYLSIGIFLVGLIALKVFTPFIKKFIHSLTTKSATKWDDIIANKIIPFIEPLGILIIGYMIISAQSSSYYTVNKIIFYTKNIIFVGIVYLCIRILNNVLEGLIYWYLEEVASKTKTKLDEQLARFCNRLFPLILWSIGLIIVLDRFNINVSALVTTLGVGSFAVAFAAKETLSNMIAGVVILFDKPFRIGDRVELPTGDVGDVVDIGIRSTKIETLDKITVIIPNSMIGAQELKNLSYPTELVRLNINVGVDYDSDIELVKKKLLESIEGIEEIEKDPAPVVYFEEFGDSSLNFRLSVYIKSHRNRLKIKSQINERICKLFREAGISIPFPHRQLLFKEPLKIESINSKNKTS